MMRLTAQPAAAEDALEETLRRAIVGAVLLAFPAADGLSRIRRRVAAQATSRKDAA
jgi:hypothetical protein